MAKIISSYDCEIRNDKNVKDLIVLTNKKTNQIAFFDNVLEKAKAKQIAGVQMVVGKDKRPVFSEKELRSVMSALGIDKCVLNIVPMADLLA